MINISKLSLLSLFSGIGAFEKGLERLNIPFKLVGFSEIDKYAITSYCAIHDVDKSLNLGDISKVDIKDVPDCDLITYGFPCQDISIAGLGKGIVKGKTRSGLLYEALRIIEGKRPKYAVAENVKNLVGKKFKSDFDDLLKELDELGYNNYWQVLNAKNYGIPQNRERVFIISIRKDIDEGRFKFPEGFDSGLRLKDFLENKVEEKYYIKNKRVDNLLKKLKTEDIVEPVICEERTDEGLRFFKGNVCGTLRTTDSGGDKRVIEKSKKPNELQLFTNLSGGKWSRIHESARRVYKEEGIAPTISTCGGGNTEPKVQTGYKIRKLTPLECWRLMGFDDGDYWKARKALEQEFYNGRDRSNSRMYKMAGNSIVVNVLVEIYKNLFKDYFKEES